MKIKIIILVSVLSLFILGCGEQPKYKYTIIDSSGGVHTFYSPETHCSEDVRFDTREPLVVTCVGKVSARFPYYTSYVVEEVEE